MVLQGYDRCQRHRPVIPDQDLASGRFIDFGPEMQIGVACAPGGRVANGDYDSEDMAMTEEALIEEAGRRLTAAAPEADIILFGSRARGEARADSDLDLLVIAPDFDRRGEEYGRLRKELRGLEVAIDLVIYRRREADEWGGVSGSFLHRALGEGRVLSGT